MVFMDYNMGNMHGDEATKKVIINDYLYYFVNLFNILDQKSNY